MNQKLIFQPLAYATNKFSYVKEYRVFLIIVSVLLILNTLASFYLINIFLSRPEHVYYLSTLNNGISRIYPCNIGKNILGGNIKPVPSRDFKKCFEDN